MRKGMSIPGALVLLVGCVGGPPPLTRSPPRLAVATGSTSAVSAVSSVAKLAGRWSGPEWGWVVLNSDGNGSYTDTYGTGPGRIELHAVGDGYEGRWVESSRRFGTLRFVLEPNGEAIVGTWAPDPRCTIGTTTGGSLRWSRDHQRDDAPPRSSTD